MEFIYTVDPLAPKPIMLLNDHVGMDPDTGKGIDGARFQAELMALDALHPECIEVWINSPGGVVMDGYNIYSSILRAKTRVDTVGVGCMASIAAVIFQAGQTRTMMDYAWLMYHNPFGGDNDDVLETMKESIAIMVARSGKPEEEITAMMNKETYITAEEALEFGFCDSIDYSADFNTGRLTPQAGTANFHTEANKILNKLIDSKTSKMSLKLVTNKLGLRADASEMSILNAINDLEKKHADKEQELNEKYADLLKQKDDIEDEIKQLKKERDSLKNAKDKAERAKADADEEMDDLRAKKADAEDRAVTSKCRNMVESYVRAGKLEDTEKVVNFWVELAKANFSIAEDQLKALPMNRRAPVINRNDGGQPSYTMGAAMLQIENKYYADKNK